MGKKDNNNLDLKTLTGTFTVLVDGNKVFAGEMEGAWDNAILIKDSILGSVIIPNNRIVAMIEGIVPGRQRPVENRKIESAEHQEMRQEE